MISLHLPPEFRAAAEEFFQLFKTPWQWEETNDSLRYGLKINDCSCGDTSTLWISVPETLHPLEQPVCMYDGGQEIPLYCGLNPMDETVEEGLLPLQGKKSFAAQRIHHAQYTEIRLGFNLFAEVHYLLTQGQTLEYAAIPTLERHIELLRKFMLEAGIAVVEIRPCPHHHDYMVCLTHDVDFVSINHYLFSVSLLGFFYRATLGTLRQALGKQRPWRDVWRNVSAVLAWPFVALRLTHDYWLQFPRYMEIEGEQGGTFYIIPFKHQAGQAVSLPHPERRATRYDIDDIAACVEQLLAKGFEIGVHGLDGWRDVQAGKDELRRIQQHSGESEIGIRTHWLCADEQSYQRFEAAGYAYDSTCGYNDTIGFKAGTTQVFKPFGVKRLLELPMHIQDVAMFYPNYLNWSHLQAEKNCERIFAHVRRYGGVVTLLWHHRSIGPERLWDEIYVRLLAKLRKDKPWFAPARTITQWFRVRRDITFTKALPKEGFIYLTCPEHNLPSPVLRVSLPAADGKGINYADFPLKPGENKIHFDCPLTSG